MKWLSDGLWRWSSCVYEHFWGTALFRISLNFFLKNIFINPAPELEVFDINVSSTRTFWSAASAPGCSGSWVRESFTEDCRCPSYSMIFIWTKTHFQAHFEGHGCLKWFHRSPGEPPTSEAKFSPSKVKQSVTFLCLHQTSTQLCSSEALLSTSKMHLHPFLMP